MEMMLTIRRFNGRFLVTYLTESGSGRQLVTVPCDLWGKGHKREIGGAPPRHFSLEMVEALAARYRVHLDLGGAPRATSLRTLIASAESESWNQHITRIERLS